MALQKQGNKSDKRSSQGFHAINDDLSFEDALLYTASLLDSASATALDCGELLDSPGRAKILAV